RRTQRAPAHRGADRHRLRRREPERDRLPGDPHVRERTAAGGFVDAASARRRDRSRAERLRAARLPRRPVGRPGAAVRPDEHRRTRLLAARRRARRPGGRAHRRPWRVDDVVAELAGARGCRAVRPGVRPRSRFEPARRCHVERPATHGDETRSGTVMKRALALAVIAVAVVLFWNALGESGLPAGPYMSTSGTPPSTAEPRTADGPAAPPRVEIEHETPPARERDAEDSTFALRVVTARGDPARGARVWIFDTDHRHTATTD